MSVYRWTILHVPDVNRTVEFYRQAFGLDTNRHDEDGSYAELASGETLLAFASHDLILRHHPPDQLRVAAGAQRPSPSIAAVSPEGQSEGEQDDSSGRTTVHGRAPCLSNRC